MFTLAVVVAVLALLGLIVWIAGAERRQKESGLPLLLCAFLGCILGGILTGIFYTRDIAGMPISEMNNNDVFKVVSISPVADDYRTVLLGLRQTADGRWYANSRRDLALRVYRVPSDIPLVQQMLRGKPSPPVNVLVFKIGDTVSLRAYENP